MLTPPQNSIRDAVFVTVTLIFFTDLPLVSVSGFYVEDRKQRGAEISAPNTDGPTAAVVPPVSRKPQRPVQLLIWSKPKHPL